MDASFFKAGYANDFGSLSKVSISSTRALFKLIIRKNGSDRLSEEILWDMYDIFNKESHQKLS